MSQQQAEDYVNSISDDDMAPFDEIGASFVDDGNDIIDSARQIDCTNYVYEWETEILTCQQGKSQLYEVGNDEVSLGRAYEKLTENNSDRSDVLVVIPLIDKLSSDYNFPIVAKLLDAATIDESRKTNAYNKSVLQATLQST